MEHTLKNKKTSAKEQKRNLTGIPTQLKKDFEMRSGLNFDDVRIHYNSSEPARLGALAFTRGTQVYMGPAQEKHLPHELGHVAQQKLGQVRPTTMIGGLPVNTDASLEEAADRIAAGPVPQDQALPVPAVIQMKRYTKEEIIAMAREEGITINEDNTLLEILSLLDCDDSTFLRVLRNTAGGAAMGGIAGSVVLGGFGALTQGTGGAVTLGKIGAMTFGGIGAVAGAVRGFREKPEEAMRNLLQFLHTLQSNSQDLNSILTEADEGQYPQTLELLRKLSGDWPVRNVDMSTMSFGDRVGNRNTKRMRSMEEIFSLPGAEASGRAFLTEFLKTAMKLYPICGYDGILNLLVSSTEYVSNNLLFDVDPNASTGYEEAARRLRQMGEFVQDAHQTLGSQAEGYQLESTGSDPHKGGKHVLKMMRKGKFERIYKPRSLKVDDAVVGENGMFAFINESINNLPRESQQQFKGLRLPTMQISSENDDYGTEEAVEKKKDFTEEEALDYYFQMGMLAVAAEYLGLSDLHQDNIMATARGPVIIDAEVAFLNRESGISAALVSSVGAKIGTSSVDGLTSDFRIHQNDSVIPSAIDNYQIEELREEQDRPYHAAYQRGYNAMQTHMRELVNNPEYTQKLQQLMSQGLSMRIVPLRTSEFAGLYTSWLMAKKAASTVKDQQREMLQEAETSIIAEIKQILTSGRLLQADDNAEIHLPLDSPADTEAEVPGSSIQDLLRNSFDRGDVPCFEVKLKEALAEPQQPDRTYPADILLDGKVVGSVTLHLHI